MTFHWQRLASWPVLSGMLGMVLLAALALKGHEIATEELPEYSLLTSRWFLVLVVEWEIFFALWLLGGFYQSYPRLTCWVALLYFFTLFVVAMDSVLKGRPTCPCFGKSIFPPWIAAAFDLVALLLLAAAPLPQAVRQPAQRSRWLGLAAAFSAFGFLSLITMGDYSTSGPIPSIRTDDRLSGAVAVQRVRPTAEELLALLGRATGLNLTLDERLKGRQPDYGVWDLKGVRSGTVMELLVVRQTIPARWEKRDDGYALVPAARFGKSLIFWFGGAALLALAMMGLRWLDIVQERKKALLGGIDREAKSVTGLRVASPH
jgi:hypothetical protein